MANEVAECSFKPAVNNNTNKKIGYSDSTSTNSLPFV